MTSTNQIAGCRLLVCHCGCGRDPTYAVARAMAAPLLHVRVPPGVPPPPPDAATADRALNGHKPHAEAADSGSESSSGLDTPRCSTGGSRVHMKGLP